MKKNFIFFFLFSIPFIFFGCAGLPKTIKMEIDKRMESRIESVNLTVSGPGLEQKFTPKKAIKFEELFKRQLTEKNIKMDINSQITLEVILKKYEDGEILKRAISGSLLGYNFGKQAEIAGQFILKKKDKVMKKGDVTVKSSKSGWNFSYGYGGVKMLEKAFIEVIIKSFF